MNLFNNQPTGSLLGGQQQQQNQGLYGQSQGLGLGLYGQQPTGQLGANKEFSLNAGPTFDDLELRNVLVDFQNAMNIQNPTECLLRAPVYDEIPATQINNPQFFWNPNYFPTLDSKVWNETQKSNPDPKKFYVSEIRGIETLQARTQNNKVLHQKQLEKVDSCIAKLDKISAAHQSDVLPRIEVVKQKNKLILDKLLIVHSLFEKLAIQYNEYDRKPNEEMRVHNLHSAMEGIPNELRNKLLDIRMSLDDIRMAPTKRSNVDEITTLPSNSKQNMLNLMEKFKKGIETLERMEQRDVKEVQLMQNYLESHRNL
jgi:hypothetical protein